MKENQNKLEKTLGIKVAFKDAEKAKNFLVGKGLIDKDFKNKKLDGSIIFPLIDSANKTTNSAELKKKFKDAEISQFELEKIQKKDNKQELLSKLTIEEISKLKTAFDTIGDIAIMEVDELLLKKEKIIAEYIMSQNKNIKTVLKKVGHHKGEFRTQDMDFVLGENKKIATYKENNVLLKLDVEKVYFSPRLATDRRRIYEQVKKGEEILAMFSGCAPYPCVFAKNTQAKEIIGIEINPEGHKWGLENVKLNKIRNVTLYHGDVKDVVPKLNRKFDRILMPLPKSAEDFLDAALLASKKGTIIHFYDFLREENIPKEAIEKIDAACKRNNRKYKIIETVKCGQHAPRTFRICVDFEVLDD